MAELEKKIYIFNMALILGGTTPKRSGKAIFTEVLLDYHEIFYLKGRRVLSEIKPHL